jgi:hypothetical protein
LPFKKSYVALLYPTFAEGAVQGIPHRPALCSQEHAARSKIETLDEATIERRARGMRELWIVLEEIVCEGVAAFFGDFDRVHPCWLIYRKDIIIVVQKSKIGHKRGV